MPAGAAAQGGPARDLAFYERLISRGTAEADDRGSVADHVTARRLALWLLARSGEDPEFIRGLVHFARTGGITRSLKTRLRVYAWAPSPGLYSRHAARLLQYAAARGIDLGRLGDNFGAACDQVDLADAILENLHARAVEERRHPGLAGGDWRERLTLKPPAIARRDEVTWAVTFILDSAVAEAAVRAIAIDSMEREARIRQFK